MEKDPSDLRQNGKLQPTDTGKVKRTISPPKQGPNNASRRSRFERSNPVNESSVIQSAGPQDLTFSAGVLGMVQAVSGMQPAQQFERKNCMIVDSDLFKYFVLSLHRSASYRSLVQPLDIKIEDISTAFRFVLACRIQQVNGARLPIPPGTLRYPSVLGPMLAAIGRFNNANGALDILPTIDIDDPDWGSIIELRYKRVKTGEDDAGKAIISDVYSHFDVKMPDNYDATISALHQLGLPENVGLPVDIITDSDMLYRFEEIDETLRASGDFVAEPHMLLVRSLLTMTAFAEIYGAHRVVYVALASLRSALDKLARDAFSMDTSVLKRS